MPSGMPDVPDKGETIPLRALVVSALVVGVSTGLAGVAPGGPDRTGPEGPPLFNALLEIATTPADSAESPPRLTCSGALIAPDLVLTARHCVAGTAEGHLLACGASPFGRPELASKLLVSVVPAPGQERDWLRVRRVWVPEEGSDLCGFDIAILSLITPVPAGTAVPFTLELDRQVQQGDRLRIPSYRRANRTHSPTIAQTSNHAEVACVGRACGIRVSRREFVLDAEVCGGGSGAPAINSGGRLVGVVSRSGRGCGPTILTDIQPHIGFIRSVAIPTSGTTRREDAARAGCSTNGRSGVGATVAHDDGVASVRSKRIEDRQGASSPGEMP